MRVLLEVLAAGGSDPVIPPIVWQNLHPLLERHGDEFTAGVTAERSRNLPLF